MIIFCVIMYTLISLGTYWQVSEEAEGWTEVGMGIVIGVFWPMFWAMGITSWAQKQDT